VTLLKKAGKDVLFDDRPKLSPGVKFADAEILGVPHIVIVGRGAATGEVEYWESSQWGAHRNVAGRRPREAQNDLVSPGG